MKYQLMSSFWKLQTATDEDLEESPYDIIEKRDNMLENLLILLNSAAAIGVGLNPTAFSRPAEEITRPRSCSTVPGSGKGIRKG